ncbi:MAG: hypothetical protein JO061_16885, partial [Acidobacteriaceae bacterium]|nr:hypothetical protein [Acidobacteriaceae bacterium]
MKFRTLMMVGVTLLDAAFFVAVLRGQNSTSEYVSLRKQFLIGLSGDSAALTQAMKEAEEVLAKNPKAAEPMVLHGAGLSYQAGAAFRAGDLQQGSQLFDRGIKEMNDAVSLQPNNPAVLIPRGATFLAASLHMPQGDETTTMLKQGLDDYL